MNLKNAPHDSSTIKGILKCLDFTNEFLTEFLILIQLNLVMLQIVMIL